MPKRAKWLRSSLSEKYDPNHILSELLRHELRILEELWKHSYRLYVLYKIKTNPATEIVGFCAALYFYTQMLIDSDFFLEILRETELVPLINEEKLDHTRVTYSAAILVVASLLGILHGSYRFVRETVPFLKAYIHVFILDRRYEFE